GDTLETDYQFQFTTAAASDALIELSHVDTGIIIPYSGSFDYGFIDVADTSNNSFRITNVGSSDLDVTNITLEGTNPAEFAISSIPAAFPFDIDAGDSEDFEVTFIPATAGDKSAVVNIESDDAVYTNYLFTVTGTAVTSSQPDIALYQGSTEIVYGDQYNFAKYGLGEASPPIPFTIKNPGNANLDVSTIQLSDSAGGRFTIVTNPSPVTIFPGADATFEMQFSSPNGVVFFGTVEIASNDPDEDPFVFRVKGMAK
ncbi:MAG: choice-of-anchor D domain-containing protein, partial [Spirochaetota bacterium]